jgi:hypothetical protein
LQTLSAGAVFGTLFPIWQFQYLIVGPQTDAANRFAQSHQTSAGAVSKSSFSSVPFKSFFLLRTKIDYAVE